MAIVPDQVISKLLGAETVETTTVQAVADVSKSLAGLSWKFSTTDGVDDYIYRFWYKVGGTGENPLLGKKETMTLTNRADVSSDSASKYFKFADGPAASETKYYCYFTVAGVGYDPGLGRAEVTDVTVTADTAGSLDGKYWTLKDGANTAFYVWYAVAGKTNTDPAPGGTGIKVCITAGAGIPEVRRATKEAINAQQTASFLVTYHATATKITITNRVNFASTDAGAADSGFTVSVATQGVTPLLNTGQALEGYTLFCVIPILAANAADEVVALAMKNAFNAKSGWTATQQAPTNDHKVDIVHKTKGNCTNAADGNVGGAFAVGVLVAGIDAVTSETPIEVDIDEDELVNDVAEKTLLAIRADLVLSLRLKGSRTTDTLTLTNRRGGNVADAADVDTTFVVTVTVHGTDTVVTSMVVAAATEFYYKPPEDKVLKLRSALLVGTQADVTDAAKFLSLTALSTGCTFDICDKDGTVLKALNPTALKSNTDLMTLGKAFIQAGTVDFLQVYINFLTELADEIVVSGGSGHYVRFKVNDATSGVASLTVNIWGYLEDAVGVGS